jgi:Ca2+-transporting ATPase
MTATPPSGLGSGEAKRLLVEHGPNAIPRAPSVNLAVRFLKQFQNPLIYVLLFALAFDIGAWVYGGSRGWPVEGLAIAAVLLLNATLGALQEHRSEQVLARLAAMTAPLAWVLRDGALTQIPSHEIVPGDVVRIEAGERVVADGKLVDAQGVMVDESVLTGESVPVDKSNDGELFSGTLVVRGKGLLRAVGTGPSSTMGKLAAVLARIEVEKTPLEKRLGGLGRQLARWVGVATLVLVGFGLFAEGVGRIEEVILFAVALAVAVIPEGMPAVVTLMLALGVQRMAKRHAVVRRLSAVEALGSVTVICTDKTGTLTENRMSVHGLDAVDKPAALVAMVVASDADIDGGAGDPLELGLLEYARHEGLDPSEVHVARPRRSLRAFDSEWKFMRVTVDEGEAGTVGYFKGAPEILIERCSLAVEEKTRWLENARRGADDGYRLLALARGKGEEEQGLTFLGLVSLWDPPRAEVPEAIRTAQEAGVRVLMVTGDHPGTAKAVAQEVGISTDETLTGAQIDSLGDAELREAARTVSVFARVNPDHKLRLIEALKADGEVVAMTGDGVNDAPALKRSDVGIAMGKRGSDVAREVADLVLLDDNFATIVGAIEEGRGIYQNIRTFVRYTFSTNIALLVLIVFGAVAAYAAGHRNTSGMLLLPLTALQLLWINFLGDGPPALALGLDRTPGVMTVPPRRAKVDLLDRDAVRFILATGAVKGFLGVSMLLVLPTLGGTFAVTQTALFLFESVGKLVSAYPARGLMHKSRPNILLHVFVGAAIVLQVLTLAIPGLRRFLGLELLGPTAAGLVCVAIFLTWLAGEAVNRSSKTSEPGGVLPTLPRPTMGGAT